MEQHMIRARRIELVDEKGDIKITLDATAPGPCIRLWGRDGKIRGSLGLLTSDRPALVFFHGPLPRVDLRLDEEGNPDVTLVNSRTLGVAEMLLRSRDEKEAEQQAAPLKKVAKARRRTKKTV